MAAQPENSPEEAGASRALTPTGRVILGMLAFGKNTGYDIKQLADLATRHFWAVSYGQIYPELGRLAEQGLVRGRPEPRGGRARTEYELTDAGSKALQDWLSSGGEQLYELRDEGLLKLFFSEVVPERRIAIVRAIRERMEGKLTQLEAIGEPPITGPSLTRSLGIHVTKAYIDWCEAAERQLAREE
jgi:PadR family transcriptional regulator AphA